jgi:nitrogen regulatory protein P-II 1
MQSFLIVLLSICRTFAPRKRQSVTIKGKKKKVTIKKEKGMKKIEAIIRKTKFEEVKAALLSSDIDWFEYHDVHGIGQSRQERIYRGVQYSTDVIERVAITIVCRDMFLDPTVKVILQVAHTGEVGDGRIFVSDMIDTWSIRTGEHGDIVLRDKK